MSHHFNNGVIILMFKKACCIFFIFISLNVYSKDDDYSRSLYDMDSASIHNIYRINKEQFRTGTDEGVYRSFQYPYFKYPFHYTIDMTGHNNQKTLFLQTGDPILERYPWYCEIMWSQPEFNMLKRCFNAKDYSFIKLDYDIDDGAEGGGFQSNFSQMINWVKDTKAHGGGSYGYGQPQGFIKGIYYDFNFFICEKTKGEMKGHRFLLALPKYLKPADLIKYPEVWILFIGTIFDYDSKLRKDYKPDVITIPFYPVIDFIILYDRRLCKDYPW